MEYVAHLLKDRKLKNLVNVNMPVRLQKRENIPVYLCASIMSQQLSTKVADVIHKRFLRLYDTNLPTPEQILETPFETLRSIGLSNAKANYVHNVARFAIEKGMGHKHLNKLSNEEVIEYLTEIKGVGQWTVEMLLMFALGREDVFAVDDLGIQNAMIKLYDLDNSDKKRFKEDLLRISKKWSPYRTYACIHLWQWKDSVPIKKD
ncbi:MAG: DNA-3-methyladenine glycosylase 2 family protein [Bacteroidetes bacterium]|nr:DNA-3-methyladenine glycosylase 2 family protein [Bacteroidota bacterium]MBS1972782.1 DNA-3-methyladenine glycosylase 2 family protein [Bacteroidota bacterium]